MYAMLFLATEVICVVSMSRRDDPDDVVCSEAAVAAQAARGADPDDGEGVVAGPQEAQGLARGMAPATR